MTSAHNMMTSSATATSFTPETEHVHGTADRSLNSLHTTHIHGDSVNVYNCALSQQSYRILTILHRVTEKLNRKHLLQEAQLPEK